MYNKWLNNRRITNVAQQATRGIMEQMNAPLLEENEYQELYDLRNEPEEDRDTNA
jgi:hypothetical protein